MKVKELSIGIDISKLTLDICVYTGNSYESHQIKNKSINIKGFIEKQIQKYGIEAVELCMENTGLYNWQIYQVCEQMGITIYVVNPLHLKRSIGMVRGKNDKIDAQRIALYLKHHREDLKPYVIPSNVIRKMQVMLTFRNRIQSIRKMLNAPVVELKSVASKSIYKEVLILTNQTLKHLTSQLQKIEKELDLLIKTDSSLYENYQRTTSVQGVGKVLAWSLLVKTNNFKTINNPRKLACFVGVVPFEYQSGTSINKTPRVSPFADKKIKKVLHMAAMRAVRLDGDLKQYYLRKVDEGKNKMLVLNAVRNKLIARICSVVNNKTFYSPHLVLS